jgi:hypothetical protein
MKKYYIAVTIKENEKYYSYVLPVYESDNLLSKLKIKNIYTAMICSTKKSAREIVTAWNDTYKYNKRFLFDDPAF